MLPDSGRPNSLSFYPPVVQDISLDGCSWSFLLWRGHTVLSLFISLSFLSSPSSLLEGIYYLFYVCYGFSLNILYYNNIWLDIVLHFMGVDFRYFMMWRYIYLYVFEDIFGVYLYIYQKSWSNIWIDCILANRMKLMDSSLAYWLLLLSM